MSNPAPTANGLKKITPGVLHDKYAWKRICTAQPPKGVEQG